MLTLAGLGDACDPNDPSGSSDACTACNGDWGIPGSCGASSVTPQFNYSAWNCAACTTSNLSPAQVSFCQQACGNTAAQQATQNSLTAQAAGLPSGVTASSLPNLPGTPAPGSLAPAINWYIVGGSGIAGLIVGALLAHSRMHRSA